MSTDLATEARPAIVAAPAPASRPHHEDGYIDFYGYAPAAGGWLFSGWSRGRWKPDARPPQVTVLFQQGRIERTESVTAWFARPDLGRRGVGIVVFVRAPGQPLGELSGIHLAIASEDHEAGPAPPALRLQPVRPVVHLRESDVEARIRPGVMNAFAGPERNRLLSLLSRRAYAGMDTLHDLPAPVRIGLDEAISVPPGGLVLLGWCLDPTNAIASIRVHGPLEARDRSSLTERWIPVERPDVVEAVSSTMGISDPRCGFVAYAPACGVPWPGGAGQAPYLEVELHSGEIGYMRIPAPTRSGASAARRILDAVRPSADEIEPAFDRVLGPALTAIHQARLARPRKVSEVSFGTGPQSPVCSVVIPLYGRMDFLTYQMALLSEHPGNAAHEFIYVLDDPPRKRELLDLAHSAHRRFGLPFRILLLEENLGYGPANNLGMAAARGEFICLLNSDVMPSPEAPGWLDGMIAELRKDATLGMVGGQLLFEDGTVQHEGITFERLPQQANWPFPMHPRKGLRVVPNGKSGPEEVEAVTGACMVLRKSLADSLRGFDEVYAIGDFEDTDLCLRVRSQGLRCALDRRAQLYHLERQSQITPDNLWRHHATLLNAWTHTRRWFPEEAGRSQPPRPLLRR
ncbi:glycosyltransferase family 2 protein [Muricoccus vinaceus]|uniref:Glycosyltransferase family 2 protein n=1 Tax=Muricoccus vinaceus TaxID=424704 RepID=A0ABV6IZZ1_9PROT